MGPVCMFPDRQTIEKGPAGQGRTKGFSRPRAASFSVLVLALVCFCSPIADALSQEETPEDKGLRIAREASDRNDGFGDFTAGMTMVLRDRHGRESVRQMRFKVLEVPEDGDKSLFVFDEPRDVQGTALLTHAHINAQDDQWLYLPALKRVKRINAARRSGSFMGSEFSYEDMSSQEVEEYTYTYLRDEPCGELTCTVTEQVPPGREIRIQPQDRLAGYGRASDLEDGALRPQELAPEDAHFCELSAISGSVLAGRGTDDGQSPDRCEHGASMD